MRSPRRSSGRDIVASLATAVAAVVVAALMPTPFGPAQAQPADESVAQADVMLTRLNEVRRDNGLAPYVPNPILTRIAFDHARDIAAKTNYSHTGSDGRKPKQRAIDAGYGAGRSGLRIGENFVARQHLDDGFQWLMDDPPHRANMLDPTYREVGVGAARMPYGYVWVMDLGWYDGIDAALAAPPTAPPPPTDPPTPVPTETPTPVPTDPPAPTTAPTAVPTEPSSATLATTAEAPAAEATGSDTTGGAGSAGEETAAPEATGAGVAPEGGGTDGGVDGGAAQPAASSRWWWLGLLGLLVLLAAGWHRRGRG